MSHPGSLLSILLCLSIFIGTICSASLPPPSISTNKIHEQKLYLPGEPSSNTPPYWLGLRITEYQSSTIKGQAVFGTLVGAMTNISLSPRETPIRSEYNFTLESGSSPPYNATIGFKVYAGLPPPLQLTNERLLVALGLLASVYSSQDDLNELWECAVDITMLMPSQGDVARIIAQGGLYVVPTPLARVGTGGGGDGPTEA
ncbi:MAG: hypothetical protein Q9204_004927 [Flavoplaca sp. TL-2023a]